MKLVKRLLKWTTRGLLVVFLLLIGWRVIAYCTSTNESDQKTIALVNPIQAVTIAPEDKSSPDCRASMSDAGLVNAPSHRDGLQSARDQGIYL